MSKFDFNPLAYKKILIPCLKEFVLKQKLDSKSYHKILRKYPKTKQTLFTKAEIIAGFRYFSNKHDLPKFSSSLLEKIKMKPIRTMSGVVPVTILTKPYPCPGKCIFCPNDIKMPKSYLSQEPGAQRAAKNKFNPYNQIISRLKAYHAIGHSTDKVELIILGGTWSFYPQEYQIWFIKKCFDALNHFHPDKNIKLSSDNTETADLQQLTLAQKKNETAKSRCIGLSLETRPDYITPQELINFRKLGCTKVQIGLQSLDDKILKLNQRGHTTKQSQQAIKLLRLAGFKIQAHWMANLYGSDPQKDIKDFHKLFSDYHYRPDELKIYPVSLLSSAPLMDYYQKKLWQPYTKDQLLKIIVTIFSKIPSYCRVTRVIRDFSSDDIVAGSKTSNLRQLVDQQLKKDNQVIKEIRSREIRDKKVSLKDLSLKTISYKTSTGQEKFLQFVDKDNRIAAFLRLSLPKEKPFIKELKNSAIIREIHVYGQALSIGDRKKTKAQHSGLGTRLIKKAALIAKKEKYIQLSVISAIGTKQYYRSRNFTDGKLYQHLEL